MFGIPDSIFYWILNLGIIALFVFLARKKNLLSFFEGGRWWLTWLAVGILTLMDEVTSIYYAPIEAYRFIGLKAVFYIALTSVIVRFLSTRMTEIAHILEANGIKGGGVYSFAYIVFGPTMSFVAISSIMVTYVLTATISTVSAVNNGLAFVDISNSVKFVLYLVIIWIITGINILGIKENAKFTYIIFIFAAFVLLNFLLGGVLNFNDTNIENLTTAWQGFSTDLTQGNPMTIYSNLVIGIGSCILAYSGIESVLQTASLVKNWKAIHRAYNFLAYTVGIVTPLVVFFALSALPVEQYEHHEYDLIPTVAMLFNGSWFGITVSVLAGFTLIMAVNTAMVASGELIEKIAERYHFNWLVAVNRQHSLYRIHVLNGIFYTAIIFLTMGSQAVLAEMYAVGLVASFAINTLSLLIYRYRSGSAKIEYKTSRTGSLLIFILLVSVFGYIIAHRLDGTVLWALVTLFFIAAGLYIAKKRPPEDKIWKQSDTPLDVIIALSDIPDKEVHLYLVRSNSPELLNPRDNSVYISFFLPRTDRPDIDLKNHFWLSISGRRSLYEMIYGILESIRYDLGESKEVHIHVGWPMSSWLDRISIGVMVYNLIRLPRLFPNFHFHMDYLPQKAASMFNK